MNHKERILKICAELNLPDGRWALAGSGSMIMHGIERVPRDLDIFCATQTWFSLRDQRTFSAVTSASAWDMFVTDPDDSKRRCDPPYLYRVIEGLEVNIFSAWRVRGGPSDIDCAFWIHNAKLVEGIPCVPLELLRDWKITYGRGKDAQDVILINNHLDGL